MVQDLSLVVESLYTPTRLSAVIAGTLSMANRGRNKNSSQFFICTAEKDYDWLDGKHVVFGHVVEGYDEVVREMDKLGADDGRPSKVVLIADCGEIND